MAYSAWVSFKGSSVLSSGRYDVSEQRLQLRFESGKQYEYADVPQSFWWGLCQSESKGSFFNTHISSSFQFVQLNGSSVPPKIESDGAKPRGQKPIEGPAPDVDLFDSVQNTYVPRMNLGSHSHLSGGVTREKVSEEDAHDLVESGDFLGAVSIYELLEEEVRREGGSSELIAYYLYNQVVCLWWAGEYPWAARRAEKFDAFIDDSCDGINTIEFTDGAIDCSVSYRIRDCLEGRAPEPELKLAVGQLRYISEGVSKPDTQAISPGSRGCLLFVLAVPTCLIISHFM
jgi:hypothetical protein